MAINPSGVARAPTLLVNLSKMAGMGIRRADQTKPRAMPSIIGFSRTLRSVLLNNAPSSFPSPAISTRTAMTLYKGTAPMIIKGAMPPVPYMFMISETPSSAALER